jgi:hypothetical protein
MVDIEVLEHLRTEEALRLGQIQNGIPLPKFNRKFRKRNKMPWLDDLQPPRLRDGKIAPRRDSSKLDVDRLNQCYILSSGFEPDIITNLGKTISNASKRTGFKFIARSVKEEHHGEMIFGTRVFRVL